MHYLERPCADYVRAAVQAAADIHREDIPGDILVFLTGARSLHRSHARWAVDEPCMSLSMLGSISAASQPALTAAGVPGTTVVEQELFMWPN